MIRTILLLAAMAAMGPAWALNMNGFRDTPIARLNGQELKAFRQTIINALDQTLDGVTVEWRAPKTKVVSKITPHNRFTEGKLRCREATIESDAQDRYQRGLYLFCKGDKGAWEFKRPAAKRKTR